MLVLFVISNGFVVNKLFSYSDLADGRVFSADME